MDADYGAKHLGGTKPGRAQLARVESCLSISPSTEAVIKLESSSRPANIPARKSYFIQTNGFYRSFGHPG